MNKIFAAVVVGGLVYSGYGLLSDKGAQGCIPDGDGAVDIVQNDGSLKKSYAWTVTDNGKECYASNGGNTPANTLPVLAR